MEKPAAQQMNGIGKEREVELIHSWSSPRSLSTCLMYSFAQRDDTEVLDEALHAYWMKVMVNDWPFDEEVPSNKIMESDGYKVVKDVFFAPGTKKYRYCKNMATHLLPATGELIKKGKHFILVRNPLDILISYNKIMPPSFLQIGLGNLANLYCELYEFGNPPPVIDASDLQRDPEGTLRGLCADLGIPFQPAMLKWEAGARSEDSISGPRWYGDAHKSTGFVPPKKYPKPFPPSLYDLLEQCLPFYNFLKRHARGSSNNATPNLTKSPRLLTNGTPQATKRLAYVDGDVLPLDTAKVSVLDFAARGADSVREGIRVTKGKLFNLEQHLDRLFQSARALALDTSMSTREEVKDAIFATLIRNNMFDNAYIRPSLARGRKVTSGEGIAYKCILTVIPEWRQKNNEETRSINVAYSVSNNPSSLRDLEGNYIDGEDGLVLDKGGYVLNYQLNDMNTVFLVRKGQVVTPSIDERCPPQVHRTTIIDLLTKEGLHLEEGRINLSDLHNADEVWIMSALGEFYQVVEINGNKVSDGKMGPAFQKLKLAYGKLIDGSGVAIPTYSQQAA